MLYDKEVYHFLFLHFPIALFITGYIFHLLYNLSDKKEINNYITWTMGMGILWSIISIVTGYIAAFELEYIQSFSNIFDKKHSFIMILSTFFFIILFILRSKDFNNKILFFFHSIAVSLIIYGTHLGAQWAERI